MRLTKQLHTIDQIKQAVNDGYRVYDSNLAYEVIKDSLDQWLIVCSLNNYTIGLSNKDGTKLNGRYFFTFL